MQRYLWVLFYSISVQRYSPIRSSQQHTVSFCLKFTLDAVPIKNMFPNWNSIGISPYNAVSIFLGDMAFGLLRANDDVVFLTQP